MRTGILIASLAALAVTHGPVPIAAAQNAGAVAPAPAGSAPAAVPDPSAARIHELTQNLIAAQQEIVRLRGEVAELQEAETALSQCRAKNGRLVAITNDLIKSYEQRYRRGKFRPFDTGRRKFEAEMQDIGDQVYDNHVDAGPRRAPPDLPANTQE